MPKIHPTAIVHPDAKIAEGVEIGPFCVVESDVEIGAGTVLSESVVIRKYTTLGKGNVVDANSVLGGLPQDLGFDPDSKTYVKIGDNNVFREGVTISRASGEGESTIVGNDTYWMVSAHAGHNSTIEDGVILANSAAIGGHATVGEKAFISSNTGVHQFCWVGELVMSQGNAGTSCHVPPFTMIARINRLVGLNLVGLKRADYISSEDRRQIKEAFRLTYRSGLTTTKALEQMDACKDWGAAAGRFRDFIRKVLEAEKPFKRPLIPMRETH